MKINIFKNSKNKKINESNYSINDTSNILFYRLFSHIYRLHINNLLSILQKCATNTFFRILAFNCKFSVVTNVTNDNVFFAYFNAEW